MTVTVTVTVMTTMTSGPVGEWRFACSFACSFPDVAMKKCTLVGNIAPPPQPCTNTMTFPRRVTPTSCTQLPHQAGASPPPLDRERAAE